LPRILIVDDDLDAASSFELALCFLGHEAVACTDGAEALRLAAELRPDVALIDIQMPGLDGYQVAWGLRTLPGLGDTLLIAVTGLTPGDRRHAYEGDFDLVLLKPVPLSELERALHHRGGGTPAPGE
jgi:CheY-like chemotaxis protein